MCGLVGCAGEPVLSLGKLFHDLLIIDVLRGPHSTGAALIDKSGDHKIVKGAVLPHFLMYHEDHKKEFNKSSTVARIGHNRQATVGTISHENAHPFVHGDIILAHNGTVSDHLMNKIKKDAPKKYETDSETICEAINRLGIDEVWSEITWGSGAAALSFYDLSEQSINLVRDSSRPLHFAYLNKKKGLVWASEPDFIELAVNRREDLVIDDNQVYWLPPDNLFTFKWDKNHIEERKRKLDKPRYTSNWRDRTNTWERFADISWEPRNNLPPFITKEHTSPTNQNTTKKPEQTPVANPKDYSGETPKAKGWSLFSFMDSFDTCAFCDASVQEIDFEKGLLINNEYFACHNCMKEGKE